MPIAAAVIGGGASLVSSLIGKHSTDKAADTQSNAASDASKVYGDAANKAIQLQRDTYDQNFSEATPYLSAGQDALKKMQDLLPGGSAAPGAYKAFDSGMTDYAPFQSKTPTYGAFAPTTQPYGAFKAPTTVDESNDPGFEARMAAGEKALNRSAAVSGRLYSGQTLKALTQFGQDYGSNEYDKVYNRDLGEYQMGYQQNQNDYTKELGQYQMGYQQNQDAYSKELGEYGLGYAQNQDTYSKRLGEYNLGYNQSLTQQANDWTRLAGVAGQGQTTLGQLMNASQQSANNQSNLITGLANNQANMIGASANANAAKAISDGSNYSSILGTGATTLSTILGLIQGRKSGSGDSAPTNP